MSRLRNSDNAVELSGTRFDVRRGAADVSSMRSRDLEVHIKRLSDFNSRTSRYMTTEEGVAGPDVVNRFLKSQRALNKQRAAKMEKYGDIKVADSDETIKEKWGVREVAQRRMSDPAVNNPFREVDKLGIKYRTPDAIAKMAAKFEAQAHPDYDDATRVKNRETLDKMLERVDEPDLQILADHMTNEQFDLMWFNPDFMTGQGLLYAQVVGRDAGTSDPGAIEAMEQIIETEMRDAIVIANWAIRIGVGS